MINENFKAKYIERVEDRLNTLLEESCGYYFEYYEKNIDEIHKLTQIIFYLKIIDIDKMVESQFNPDKMLSMLDNPMLKDMLDKFQFPK